MLFKNISHLCIVVKEYYSVHINHDINTEEYKFYGWYIHNND